MQVGKSGVQNRNCDTEKNRLETIDHQARRKQYRNRSRRKTTAKQRVQYESLDEEKDQTMERNSGETYTMLT